MLGLIKKDFLLIKSNLKTMIMIFIVFFIMILQGFFESTFVIPLIGIMLFISTFSYDDFNKWNAYAVTLPNGRRNVVRAKYIASIILTIILGIVSIAISITISNVKTIEINIQEMLVSLLGTIFSVIIIISLMYPIVFKFGSTNGRIILFAVVFGITAIIGVISNFVDMEAIISTINVLDNNYYIVIPVISILILSGSYLISNKIYQNKEF